MKKESLSTIKFGMSLENLILLEKMTLKVLVVFHPIIIQFNFLTDIIKQRAQLLHLKFPCPKGERYSDSNFWVTHETHNETKTVVNLKKLCFRFIYKNNQLFPSLNNHIPLDLLEGTFLLCST